MSYPMFSNEFSDWEHPAHFTLVKKKIVDHEVIEFGDSIQFDGVFYPMKPQQVVLKPEGQRTWQWWTLLTPKELMMDDVVTFNNIEYRVFGKQDFWHISGEYIYDLAEAFHSL
jgi:hypothetical protein